jgi:adenine-specific DNA-methyltransferase
MPTPTTTITDSKFNALKAKLRELFELDKSDLDFGIYRIIAAKNKEVIEFLDRQLKDVVRATLAAHGAGAVDQVQAELDKTITSLRAAEVPDEQIETNKKVSDLRAKLAATGGAAAADLEADIYNHLLAFFGRYYDEGDFISQRRYKGDTYAIPYSGEEVTLHWANKDQYYIKSGEWHKDYRFKVGDKSVRFKLVEATQEVSNNKEADDAKRRYILAADNAVEATAAELALRFEFRVPTQAEKDRAASGAVAVFGGDYAKPSNPKKGDDREQFCADAEKRAIGAMPEAWRALIAVPGAAATEGKPARTLLAKHLDHFSARNTFDYFIHKDLGGFLRRELDFYIKNEVVRLDDLESLPADHLQRVQGKVKAIRAVAGRLIAFLASLEDFQKKMWLKKKLVLDTNWLVTIDRIPARLRDTVATNAEQWSEWERLGFKPQQSGSGDLFAGAAWGTRAYLDACDKLVVDTALFDAAFAAEVISDERASADAGTLNDAISGLLINGENLNSLRLLAPTYAGSIQCIYIDPPYNTAASEIAYKNNYKHSSWNSLIYDRIEVGRQFLHPGGFLAVTIDYEELFDLGKVTDALFSPESRVGIVTVFINPKGRQHERFFSSSTEYMLVYAMDPTTAEFSRTTIDPAKAEEFALDDHDGKFRLDEFARMRSSTMRARKPDCYYPIYVSPDLGVLTTTKTAGFAEIFPVDRNGVEYSWKVLPATFEENNKAGLYVAQRTASGIRIFNKYYEQQVYPNIWTDKRYFPEFQGTNVLKAMIGDGVFSYPKSVHAVADLIKLTTSAGDMVLDYFGGSGTTAHAVCQLNRQGDERRRFILIEMGRYYYTATKPRTVKSLYSPDWRECTAQTHDKGMSALVKYFAVETYDDALSNLPAPSGTLLDDRTDTEKDALITYGLDLELGPHLLNLDAFRDPWGYTINAQLAGDAEIKRHRVDLVETFNYLIGLKVHAYGPLERYSADFERAAHADGLGRMKLTGRLRRDPNGPYVFQRVEGELNDGNATRVLVVWRKLTDDPEKDAAVLDAWMARHRESTRERTEHRDYHLIYINGPVTLPQPTAEIRTVFPTEETFKIKMFEDTDSASQTGGANG